MTREAPTRRLSPQQGERTDEGRKLDGLHQDSRAQSVTEDKYTNLSFAEPNMTANSLVVFGLPSHD